MSHSLPYLIWPLCSVPKHQTHTHAVPNFPRPVELALLGTGVLIGSTPGEYPGVTHTHAPSASFTGRCTTHTSLPVPPLFSFLPSFKSLSVGGYQGPILPLLTPNTLGHVIKMPLPLFNYKGVSVFLCPQGPFPCTHQPAGLWPVLSTSVLQSVAFSSRIQQKGQIGFALLRRKASVAPGVSGLLALPLCPA